MDAGIPIYADVQSFRTGKLVYYSRCGELQNAVLLEFVLSRRGTVYSTHIYREVHHIVG